MQPKPLILPGNWHTLGIDQKAQYLLTTRQAKSYSDACSILSRMRRKKVENTAHP